ncbi:hypothetical protein PRBRB14_18060 [Hallella multisaccharivorax DSM 17128]|uniref:Galactosyltransferase C-terminal domain-containing protein n=1 Tax=Hallella multisaccharivorax DSM 17128 TaxID=688246 RepID=F8N9Z1_9BACT|nr:galactosyltransferase-related protein [Hallella multisaccharivorax]EGN57808.1 hypothetical protein Premu_2436 [Hallella multisaccharivorax DSM 17128]GJG30927.1 hypothetical protein PRBRB14_18060 [Hallella multisaccharivorax DSM 17128]
MNGLKNCTFIIPFRIDCPERQRNLSFVLHWLAHIDAKIALIEADTISRIDKTSFTENISYRFVEDHNPIFHRTHYINTLLEQSNTDVVSIWDADIVTKYEQIEEAVQNIMKGNTLTYPYHKECIMLSPEDTEKFLKTEDFTCINHQESHPIINRTFCGGAFFVNRQKYLSLGGENEHFIGWGPEDAERLRRVQIMKHPIKWTVKGNAYHLYHPRNENSRFFDEKTAIELRKEFVKICCMNKKELHEYIKTSLKQSI